MPSEASPKLDASKVKLGHGRPAGRRVEHDSHPSNFSEIVMDLANTVVSVKHGRGHKRMTLFEALLRRIASGPVQRRASVMNFIRLVFESASEVETMRSDAPSRETDLTTLKEMLLDPPIDSERIAVRICNDVLEFTVAEKDWKLN